MLDLLIQGGTVIDGSGRGRWISDVAIEGGKIVEIRPDLTGDAREVIEARGLVVCPGFIDIHSHTDFTLSQNPLCESKLRQGITTEVVGNCGFTAAPVCPDHFNDLMGYLTNTTSITEEEKRTWSWRTQVDFLDWACRNGSALNVATLVGHGTLRIAAAGFEKKRLDPGDLSRLGDLLEGELERGAKGLSLGLQYEPGAFASEEELCSLAERLQRRGGFLAVHLRDESDGLLESMAEVIGVAEKTGVSLQISHLKTEGRRNWGKALEALHLVEQARTRGLPVSFDVYPYLAYGSGLVDLVPSWCRDRGIGGLLALLADPGSRDKILREMQDFYGASSFHDWSNYRISSAALPYRKEVEGRTIAQIANAWGCEAEKAVIELIADAEGAVKMVVFGMCEEDVRSFIVHEASMIASDGRAVAPVGPLGVGKIHPRYYGAFPRVLCRYVREQGVLNLEEAIQKMTSLPAAKSNLRGRGLLREGFWADVTLFDPERVRDCADYDDPHRFAEGIQWVIVNGEVVFSEGAYRGVLPGRRL